MKQLKTASQHAIDAFEQTKKAIHHLHMAKFLLRYSSNSKCYKAICEALSSLECYKDVQDKVVATLLEEDKNNESHHLDDKNSRI